MKKVSSELVFRNQLWCHPGPAAWFFITLTPVAAMAIRRLLAGYPRRPGFGSVRVIATIGEITWPTSVFPDRVSGSYVLPVKAVVRRKANLSAGQLLNVRLQVVG